MSSWSPTIQSTYWTRTGIKRYRNRSSTPWTIAARTIRTSENNFVAGHRFSPSIKNPRLKAIVISSPVVGVNVVFDVARVVALGAHFKVSFLHGEPD